MIHFTKDPEAKLDYAVNWADWLEEGDTISSSTWTVPPGLTVSDEQIAGGMTVLWLAGGTAGQSYRVSNRVATAGGRIDERSFLVHVQDR